MDDGDERDFIDAGCPARFPWKEGNCIWEVIIQIMGIPIVFLRFDRRTARCWGGCVPG